MADILGFTILFLAISLVVSLEMTIYKTIERIRKWKNADSTNKDYVSHRN